MSSLNLGDGDVEQIAELGRRTAEQTVIAPSTGDPELDASLIMRLRRDDETVQMVDLEHLLPTPRQARGGAELTDPTSFAQYVARLHVAGTPATTVWADQAQARVVAVFNDHQSADSGNWRDLRARLSVQVDPDWKLWRHYDNQPRSQVAFGEFLQDMAHTIVDPPAADLYQIATQFTAHRSASFESGVRQQSGDVSFEYREETKTNTKKGSIEVPEKFTVALIPYVGAEPVQMAAHLRYRVSAEDGLKLWYRLQRPDLAEREAFESILTDIGQHIPDEVLVLRGSAPEPLR